jgi:general secretion pathway protein D
MVRVGKLGRYPTIGRGICAALILLSMSLLVSCNSATIGTSNDGSQLDIMDKVRSLDLLPHQPQPVNAGTTTSGQNRGNNRPLMYEGAEVTAVSDERPPGIER